jgi:hypothetical protein
MKSEVNKYFDQWREHVWSASRGAEFNTPDSSGKPAGCGAPEELERLAGIGPSKDGKLGADEF